MSGSDQKTQIATEMPPEVAAALARGAPPAPAGARTVMAQAPSLPPPGAAGGPPPAAPPMGAPPPAAPPMTAGTAPEGARTMIAQAPSIPGPPSGGPVVATGPQQATMYATPAPQLPPPSSMAATLPPGARTPSIPLTMRPAALAFGAAAPSVGFPPLAKWIIGPAIALIVGLLTTAVANRIWPPEQGAVGGPSLLVPSRKIKIVTDPPGATVEVNGKALDAKTPTDVKGDVGSTAKLRIVLDGFDPVEMRILFAKDERPPLNIRMPKLGSTKAKTADPSQFDTKVGVQEDEGDKTAKTEKTDDKTAKPDDKAAKTAKTEPEEDDKKSKKGKKVAKAEEEEEDDKKSKKGKKDKTDKADKTAVKKDKPTLTITVRPWAIVYIDGKKIQQTPLRDYAISPGSHTVLLMNDSKGKRESIKLKVVAGEKINPITRTWE